MKVAGCGLRFYFCGCFLGNAETQRHRVFLFVYVSEILYFVLDDKEEDTPLRLILGDIASFRVTRIEKSQFSAQNATCNPQPGVAFLRIFWAVATSTRCNPIKYNIYYFFQVIYIRYAYVRGHARGNATSGCGLRLRFHPLGKGATTRNRTPKNATRNPQLATAIGFRFPWYFRIIFTISLTRLYVLQIRL